jgi:hypothetical protein
MFSSPAAGREFGSHIAHQAAIARAGPCAPFFCVPVAAPDASSAGSFPALGSAGTPFDVCFFYFGIAHLLPNASFFRSRRIACVVVDVDSWIRMGRRRRLGAEC